MVAAKGRPRWAWVVLALALAIHATFLLSLSTRTLNRLFNDTYNRPGPSADFFSVYHAGRQIVTGRDPYLPDESPRVTPPFAPYRYPPVVALTVGVVVAQVDPWSAYTGWILVLELVLVTNLVLLRRMIHVPLHRDLLCAAWLSFPPLYVELWMGQWTLATGSLVFWAYLAWQAKRDRLATGLWSAASVIKLFPLALMPLLLRQRRVVAVGVGLGALGLSLVWFVWHADDFTIFIRLNFTEVDLRSFHAGNFGLQAFLYHAISVAEPLSAAAWRPIATAVTIALLLVTTVAMTRRADADPRVSMAMALLLLPLVSKHAWEHHYVLVLPALTLLVAAWASAPDRLGGLCVAFALLWLPSPLILLESGDPTWYPDDAWSPLTRAIYHAVKPLTVLGLFLVCARQQLERRASGAGSRSSS
jgi:hypothetical protein